MTLEALASGVRVLTHRAKRGPTADVSVELCVSVVILLSSLLFAGCGKEGPPLPPLHLAPGPVANVVARRQANEVQFTFVLPTRNQDGSSPMELEHIEIFAATVAAGAMVRPITSC